MIDANRNNIPQGKALGSAPEMLTIKEAAPRLGLPEYTVRHMVKSNKLPHIKVGRKALVNVTRSLQLLQNLPCALDGSEQ